jgi:hypothetical protein
MLETLRACLIAVRHDSESGLPRCSAARPSRGGLQYSRRNAVTVHRTSADLLHCHADGAARIFQQWPYVDRFRRYSSGQGVQRSFVNTASQEWRLLDAGTGLGHEPVGSPQLYLPIATPEILLRAAAVLHLAEPAHGLLHLPLGRATHKVNATFAGAPLSTPAVAVFGVPCGKWHRLSAITCAATCTYGAADISGVLALRAALH